MIETESVLESHLSECDGSNESGTESNVNRVSTKEVIDQFIKPTILLEDKRRSRTRSVGRPPSQVFMKEKILQNMNLDNSDDEAKIKPIPKIKTTFVEITEKLKTDSSSTTPWKNISLKKSSGPIMKSALKDKVAPWLQELHERRNQKTSSGEGLTVTKSIQEGERYTIVEINRGDIKTKAYDDSHKKNIFESSQTIKIKVKEQADSVNASKKQFSSSIYRIPRELRRHTVHTNLEDVLDNYDKVDNAKKEQLPNDEDAKKIEADEKHNLIKSLEERIEQFLTQMQNSQATLVQELKEIESSIDNQLERTVLAIEEIKKELLTLKDKL